MLMYTFCTVMSAV